MSADDGELPHLSTFSTAAELGSFTAAAKALGLTQAAVSQRIQSLERALDRSLFARRGGRVALTEAGRTLYAYAQRIHDLHREARHEFAGHAPPRTGELVIAASSVPGEHLLPTLLSEFGRRHPHLRVRAAVSDSLAVIERLERGEATLGLVGQKVEKPHLEFRHLARDRMVLVAPVGHPLTRRKAVTLDQLAAHPLILRETGSGLRHCFERELERVGRSVTAFKVTLELGSNEAIKEAVQRGAGVAVLSVFALDRELDTGRLVALPLKDLHCDRDMYVVQDRRRALPFPAQLFLAYLESNPVRMPAS
jgi:DNA-binding transcriptional LysR family regulator